jgi:transcriptional regulator with XRE-family HTH domain
MGARLRKIRNHLGITQVELSEKLGVTNDTVSRWERGVLKIGRDSLISIADMLDTSVDYLLGKADEHEPRIRKGDRLEPAKDGTSIEKDDNPLRKASKDLLDSMTEEQLRKSYDFLLDQKRLAELLKEKGA